MPRFPGYGLPFQYYRPSNYRPPAPVLQPVQNTLNITPEESPKLEKSSPPKNKPDTPVWLDLFGIKLYFDDVLILSLLFFLYKEEVKDEGLFLALVLLLIS